MPKIFSSLSIKILASVAIFLSFILIISNNLDPDLGWHIKSGEWIITHLEIQHFDEFSFSMAGYRWVNHEWLVDIFLFLTQTNHLWWLTILLFSSLASLPPIYYIFRSQNKLDLMLIFGTAFSLTPYLGIRPQIISWFIFFILARFLQNLFNQKSFILIDSLKIIILFWLWSNLHASFPAGFLLYFIFILTNYFHQKRKLPILRHIITFFTSIGITLINPYGLELFTEIIQVALSGSTSQYIVEWQSVFVFFSLENWTIIATAILLLIGFRKKINIFNLFSATIFLLAYAKSVRIGPFFFITLYPIIITTAPHIIKKIKKSISQSPTLKSQLTYTIAILLLISLTNIAGKIAFIKPPKTPDQAINFLQNNFKPQQITLFNAYSWGGYLINHYPENKVFIDGRMPHWTNQTGQSAMRDYTKINTQTNAWKEIFPKYSINTVFIKNINRDKTKNFLTKKIFYLLNQYPTLNIFAQKYVQPPLVDLESELIKNDWQKIYEDNLIVILRQSTPNQ